LRAASSRRWVRITAVWSTSSLAKRPHHLFAVSKAWMNGQSGDCIRPLPPHLTRSTTTNVLSSGNSQSDISCLTAISKRTISISPTVGKPQCHSLAMEGNRLIVSS
jgi:hypothetical protein